MIVTNGSALLTESYPAGQRSHRSRRNGDGEFRARQSAGSVNSTNLVATLQAGGGVTAPGRPSNLWRR